MSWGLLDDKLHSHPKAIEAGLEAMGAWTLSKSHCHDYETDGVVSRAAALRICGGPSVLKRVSAALVRVGLWEAVDGGWRFHDWLDWNESVENIRAAKSGLSQKRAEAGRRGAASRWGRQGTCPPRHEQDYGNGDGKRDGKTDVTETATVGQTDGPIPTPIPRPDRREKETRAGAGVREPRVLVPIEPDHPLTDELREVAEGIAMATGHQPDVELEWAHFLADCAKRGKATASIRDEWKSWLIVGAKMARDARGRARDREQSRGPRRAGPPLQPVPEDAEYIRNAEEA